MAEKQARQYGPAAWSDSLRAKVYHIVGENDDDPANQDAVEKWVSNFERLATKFRLDHEQLIAGLK